VFFLRHPGCRNQAVLGRIRLHLRFVQRLINVVTPPNFIREGIIMC
jgi:hypothetical protein